MMRGPRATGGLLAAALLAVLAAGAADALTGDDISVTSLYLLPVAWVAWSSRPSVAVLVALVSATAYLLGDFVFTDALPEHPSYAPALNTAGNLVIYTAVIVAVTRVRRTHDHNVRLLSELRAAHEQVRTLEGLLPICAWCKRIRDEGDRWQPVEAYVAAHTDASFTHGICPACAENLRGGQASR